MRRILRQADGRLTKAWALQRFREVLGGPPVGDVHELKLRIRREGLLQGRVDVAWLLLQIVASPLPRGDEVRRVGRGTSKALIRVTDSDIRHPISWAEGQADAGDERQQQDP